MKRTDLIRKLEEAGCALIRHGGKHDWYRNSRTGVSQPVPRPSGVNADATLPLMANASQRRLW
jgi:hypothetical protein